MTDITSPLHSIADVELSERIRQQLAQSRGLEPRDYSHYTPRPVEMPAQKEARQANRPG